METIIWWILFIVIMYLIIGNLPDGCKDDKNNTSLDWKEIPSKEDRVAAHKLVDDIASGKIKTHPLGSRSKE